MKTIVKVFPIVLMCISAYAAQDPGWPRQKTMQGTTLVYYQPQIDDWKDYKQLDARMAVSLTPADGKQTVGVVYLRARTDVNFDDHTVLLSKFQITNTSFPALEPASAKSMDQLVRAFLPENFTQTIALERLVAGVNKAKTPPPAVAVKNTPPAIFVSYAPAILLEVDGEPVRAAVKDTKLESVANSNFPLFFEKKTGKYFLFTGKQWLTTANLQGTWLGTSSLPKDMSKITKDANWADLKDFIPPPPGSTTQVPKVFYANRPAELIAFQGQPVFSRVPGTQLLYVTNTEATVFLYDATKTYYYLTAGRWFSAANLAGPWKYATPELPADFSKIPSGSPVAGVLASVPGTPEAADAVLLAQIPMTAVVNPTEAAAKVKVNYYGKPEFKPIPDTSLKYAVNTPEKVIQVGDLYYVCFQGIWFVSSKPEGPWETAKSVPQEIYKIPPSSPVYNVTYVTQTESSDGEIHSSCTAGYFGTFVAGFTMGAVLTWGTGYYYPPYYGWGYGGYPAYYAYPATYGARGWYSPYTGAYGAGRGVYGPYGGVRGGTSYNPYTGTYARGGTAYGPYGSRSAARAYNPYTGAYGATRQGSSPYSQWGSSVVGRGNQAVATQHVTTARGTVGSAQTAAGGRAVAGTGARGSGAVGRTAGGDLYAGKDGNVYRNTGGGWQQYNNGNWSNVNSPRERPTSASGSSGRGNTSFDRASTGSLNQEFQNRQRGATESQRFQSAQRSGAGGGFRGGRGGGRRR